MAKLNEMNREELLAHRDAVDQALKDLDERRYADARAAAEEAALKHGLTLNDIYSGRVGGMAMQAQKKTAKAPRNPRPAKFRHPENHELTYSGAARRPKWFAELLESGYTEDQLLIENQQKAG